jgi:N-acetylglucosaminyldiphosphoundecaprenol N-acetyl-beta-D-mannosaminyltransferase
MTSPKKELFLDRWQEQLGVPVLHGVGGSFDVVAGKVRRAPERWQRMGLEWAYRLVQEPRRMWRRYLVTNTLFLGLLLKELVRRTPPRTASPQRTKS